MSWTKQQIVEEAYAELALQGYVYDLDAEELERGKRRLDMLMALWNRKDICLSYPLPSAQSASQLDQDSNIPDCAIQAAVLNLAVALAPGLGKAVTLETKAEAKLAYDTLLAIAAQPQQTQFDSRMPVGAGYKTYRGGYNNPFFPPPTEAVTTTPGGSEIDL